MAREFDDSKNVGVMKNNDHYAKTKEFHRISAVEKDGYYDAVTGCGKVGRYTYVQSRVRKIVLNTLNQLLKGGNSDISSAIDVGCGRGDFAIEIATRYSQLTQIHGCDFVKEAILIAKRLSELMKKLHFHEANMLNMPFDEHSFDLTICINALHHIHTEDMEKAFSELARITKRYLILEIKNNNNFIYKYIHPKSFHGINVYPTSIEKTSDILRSYNFRLVKTSGIFLFNWLSPLVVILYEKQT